MDFTGGDNPTEPKLNNAAPGFHTPQDVVPPAANPVAPTPVDLPAAAAANPTPANDLSGIHFEEPSTSPAVNPPAGGPTTTNVTVKPGKPAKPAKVKQGGKGGGAAKSVLITLLVLLLIAGAGAGGYFYGQTVGRDKTLKAVQADQDAAAQKSQDATADKVDTTPSNTSDLVLGELKSPTYADESITGEVGKQVEANDGLVLKVSSIERNYQTTDPNYKIETGKELIKVNIQVGNIAKDKPLNLTPANFRLVNSTGTSLTNETIASYDGKFDTLNIQPGKQTKGSIIYKVDKDEKPLSFVREQQYRVAPDNKVVTTKITITLTN